jgi:predicted membrane-bound mannosyltransferase
MRILFAAVAAVLVQPLLFVCTFAPAVWVLTSAQALRGLAFLMICVLVLATTVVAVLGVPAFLVLRRMRRESRKFVAATGFVLGSLPMMALTWPDVLNVGVPFFGCHGLVGALVFRAVWCRGERPI